MRQWWINANLYDMGNKSFFKYLLVRDYSPEGKGKVVGYAKWHVPVGEERLKIEDRFPLWIEEEDVRLCGVFFGGLGEERRALMGNEQYYCGFDA